MFNMPMGNKPKEPEKPIVNNKDIPKILKNRLMDFTVKSFGGPIIKPREPLVEKEAPKKLETNQLPNEPK
jgi:hypothetical protein